ncbi:hypothetical protein [Roseiconus lacunae]|uniref:hypothetical protein n=1 Tax=Roseiconus lacunae TaxID=2605694 RepID=UPI001E4BA5BC|nr:hypothetical protein [Roseiconus lacunae]
MSCRVLALNFGCGYSASDVDRCNTVIGRFFGELQGCIDEPAIFDAVKFVVKQLNKLNGSCDGCLIETDHRADLCELILTASKERGLATDEDVTERWWEC